VAQRLIQGGRAADGLPGLLIENVAEVATLAGGLRLGVRMDDPALLVAPNGDTSTDQAPVVATWEGRILAAGPRDELLRALEGSGYPIARFTRLDAAGGTITPGLIDPHTHLLFAGTRENELVLRQRGADYLKILKAGGGILSTVTATRAASEEELAEHGRRWLAEMLSHGTTTIEAKSGYGLDLPTELRLLEARRPGA
jgi:imidazolonepropionase